MKDNKTIIAEICEEIGIERIHGFEFGSPARPDLKHVLKSTRKNVIGVPDRSIQRTHAAASR